MYCTTGILGWTEIASCWMDGGGRREEGGERRMYCTECTKSMMARLC